MNCKACFNLDHDLPPDYPSAFSNTLICARCHEEEKKLPAYGRVCAIRHLYIENRETPPSFPKAPPPEMLDQYRYAFPSDRTFGLDALQEKIKVHVGILLGDYWEVKVVPVWDLWGMTEESWRSAKKQDFCNKYAPENFLVVGIRGCSFQLDEHGYWRFVEADDITGGRGGSRITASDEETLYNLVNRWVEILSS